MNDKILYKINKYKSKFSKEFNQQSKLIYARKYLQYIDLIQNKIKCDSQQIHQVGGTFQDINRIIQESNELLEQINDYISTLNPIYQLVENFDNEIKTINPGYQGYNNTQDLIKYYDNINDQINLILN